MTNDQINQALPVFNDIVAKQRSITALRRFGASLEEPGDVTVEFHKKGSYAKYGSLTPGLIQALVASIIDYETESLNELKKQFLEI